MYRSPFYRLFLGSLANQTGVWYHKIMVHDKLISKGDDKQGTRAPKNNQRGCSMSVFNEKIPLLGCFYGILFFKGGCLTPTPRYEYDLGTQYSETAKNNILQPSLLFSCYMYSRCDYHVNNLFM